MDGPHYGELVYRIDADDRITRVNEGWDCFATANDAPELRQPDILGRSLWDFIHGDEVRHLHRVLLERARKGNRILDLPFRCDSPEVRRFMLMDLWPLPDDEVEYRCRVQYRELRPPVALFERHAPRKGPLLRMCAWCRRVDIGDDTWVEVEDAIAILNLFENDNLPPLTHTVCPRDRRLVGLD